MEPNMKNIWAKIIFVSIWGFWIKADNYTFIGYLSLPFKKEPIDFCLYFDGSCVPVQYSSYIFNGYSQNINILITASENIVHQLDQDNNTVTLMLKKDNRIKSKKDNYEFYSIVRIVKDGMYTWDIQKNILDDVIPLNTLRIQLDPKKIDIKLDNVTWKMSSKKFKLPQIVIKGNPELVRDQILRCCMSLADSKSFYAKQKTKVVEADNLTLNAILPE